MTMSNLALSIFLSAIVLALAFNCATASTDHRQPVGFVHPNHSMVRTKILGTSPPSSHSSTHQRLHGFAFPWFGGDDDETNGSSKSGGVGSGSSTGGSSSGRGSSSEDDAVNANLKGVASIMESMDRFRNSQRVGDKTNGILQDLSNTYVEGVAADGQVKVTLNGQQRPINVQIDDGYLQTLIDAKAAAGTGSGKVNGKKIPGTTTVAQDLCDVLIQAMQDGHAKSIDKMEEKMKGFYSDLGLSD